MFNKPSKIISFLQYFRMPKINKFLILLVYPMISLWSNLWSFSSFWILFLSSSSLLISYLNPVSLVVHLFSFGLEKIVMILQKLQLLCSLDLSVHFFNFFLFSSTYNDKFRGIPTSFSNLEQFQKMGLYSIFPKNFHSFRKWTFTLFSQRIFIVKSLCMWLRAAMMVTYRCLLGFLPPDTSQDPEVSNGWPREASHKSFRQWQ